MSCVVRQFDLQSTQKMTTTIYVLFFFSLFLVSEIIFPHKVRCLNMSCGDSHLGFAINTKRHIHFVKDWHPRHIPPMFAVKWLLRFQIRIVSKYFPTGSYVKFALWCWRSRMSNRHNKFCKGPYKDYFMYSLGSIKYIVS